jgi:germination protein M
MAKRRSTRRSSVPRRHRGIGFLFWLCLVAIIVAVGFAARGSIQAAFARLAAGVPSGQHPAGGAPTQQHPAPVAPQVTIAPLNESGRHAPAAPAPNAPETTRPPAPAGTGTNLQTVTPTQKPIVRKSRLFFVTVDPSGRLLMKSVIRPIPASDSPLRDTLEALLKGPTAQELNGGMLSMIPTEAKLRAVTVRGDTAVIDFNEGFRFNPQGIEALNAQLRQVVYAATEFPSVRDVQVLIEGKKVRSLGTEGLRIDTPLSRASFQQ